MLRKLQLYFPSATVWAYNNTISFRMFTFEILNFQNYFIGTTHKFWKQTAHNWQTSIDTTQTNDWFFIFWNLFSSLLLKLSTQFEIRPCLQDLSTAAISEWMLHLHTYFSSVALNNTDTNFTDPFFLLAEVPL